MEPDHVPQQWNRQQLLEHEGRQTRVRLILKVLIKLVWNYRSQKRYIPYSDTLLAPSRPSRPESLPMSTYWSMNELMFFIKDNRIAGFWNEIQSLFRYRPALEYRPVTDFYGIPAEGYW